MPNAAGILIDQWSDSPPASSSRTRMSDSSLSRAASDPPPEPAPMMMSSNLAMVALGVYCRSASKRATRRDRYPDYRHQRRAHRRGYSPAQTRSPRSVEGLSTQFDGWFRPINPPAHLRHSTAPARRSQYTASTSIRSIDFTKGWKEALVQPRASKTKSILLCQNLTGEVQKSRTVAFLTFAKQEPNG